MIIIGNARLLARNPLWNALLTHFQERDCLVEGTVNTYDKYLIEIYVLLRCVFNCSQKCVLTGV